MSTEAAPETVQATASDHLIVLVKEALTAAANAAHAAADAHDALLEALRQEASFPETRRRSSRLTLRRR